MSTENGTPVVTLFDFSQDKWQADVKHLDAEKRSLFLKALELGFPDLRWNDEDNLSSFIPTNDYIDCGLFHKNRVSYGPELFGFQLATQAQVSLFISEYMDKVSKMEKELVPVGVIHDDGVCSLIEMGVKPPSLHVPGAKDDKAKPRLGLVFEGFALALEEVGNVGTFGANKYTDNGWASVPNGQARYTDAMYRHLMAQAKGEAFDEESSLLHASHTAWNALARLEIELRELRAKFEEGF